MDHYYRKEFQLQLELDMCKEYILMGYKNLLNFNLKSKIREFVQDDEIDSIYLHAFFSPSLERPEDYETRYVESLADEDVPTKIREDFVQFESFIEQSKSPEQRIRDKKHFIAIYNLCKDLLKDQYCVEKG